MFKDALTCITRRLEAAKAAGSLDEFALIGAMAMAAAGYLRGTDDLDFAISLSDVLPRQLAATLGGQYSAGDRTDPLRGLIKVPIPSTDGPTIQVDLAIFPARWNRVLFESLQRIQIEGLSIPTINWHALILTKVYAAGPQDMLDVIELINRTHPREDELLTLARTAKALHIDRDFLRFARRILSGATLRKIVAVTRLP